MWLAVNHNIGITSGERVRCSKRIARKSETGSCHQICLIHVAMNGCKISKDSLKACFENVDIHVYTLMYIHVQGIRYCMVCASVRKGNPRALPSRTDAQTYTDYPLNQLCI